MKQAAEPDVNGSGSELERRLASLSPEKRALLERRLLDRSGANDQQAPAILAHHHDGPAPMSFVQELMWLVHEMSPGTYAYNSSSAWRLRGPLNVDALERSIKHIVKRHASLRTSFDLEDGVPMQIVHADATIGLEQVQAHGADSETLLETLRGLVRRPFDLRAPGLLRVTLVEIAAEDHVLLTSANHIVWDGWSKGIYLRELAELYDAYSTGRSPRLAELPIQYADYAAWQREWLSGERLQDQLEYWKTKLAGAPPLLELPTDRPRPAVESHHGDRLELWLDSAMISGLRTLAKEHGVTLFMVLVGAWATYLHRFSGQDEIVLGTPNAGRNRIEVEGLIGYFNNTLALRIDCSGDPSFGRLLQRVRETALSAYAHQDVSFEHVVRHLAPTRDTSYSPVFQSLIVLQNATSESLALPGLESEMIVTESGTAKFDLSLGMGEYQGRLHASFEYASDLFDRDTVKRVRAQFAHLIEGIVTEPERPLSELPLLSGEERDEVLAAASGPVRPIPDQTLHGLFAERAAATPDAIALSSAEGELTYSQLQERSGAVAGVLGELRTGRRVGLCMDRSPDLVVALLAILQTGAACVPLDPDYPAQRLAAMMEDAELEYVVADDHYAALVRELGGHPVSVRAASTSSSLAPPHPQSAPGDPAYVIFTSGSTGRPKGVVLEHRGLVNHALAAIELFGVSAEDRVLQFSSISFDISLEEIFCSLLAGAVLVLRDPDMPLGGPGLLDWLQRRQVTVMDLPTAFWHEWVRDLDDSGSAPNQSLRLVVVGGEKASSEAFEVWRRRAPQVRWINTYGPTEASVIATAFEPPIDWSPDAELPIGEPLPNVAVHVLDEQRRPVPPGFRGELYIGGAGVARGYLDQPEATAASFPTLAWSGERVYGTGDVVRRRGDGLLEFVGRTDQQIKLRGFRIEPAEVEAALVEAPGVTAALAIVKGGADSRLVGYVVCDGTATPDPAEIRRAAAERLPAFAVPSTVVVLEAFPLTPNGKVDRAALPEPGATLETVARVEPRDDTDRVFAEIWSELLGTEVGIDDDFFALGGHSMLAVRMLTQVEKRLGVRLRLAAMVRAPTIRGLADGIATGRAGAEVTWQALVELKPEGTRPPLFLIHSLTGDVLIYRDLVRRLAPEQPAWGLEALGADGQQLPMLAIPDMARHYIDEIRSVQPHGPYYLAGYCYGGDVAFEMAGQLETAGEEVSFVGLIEANPLGLRPRTATGHQLRQLIRRNLAELFDLPVANLAAFMSSNARSLKKQIEKGLRWLIKKHFYLRRGRALPPSMVDMMELNYAAAAGYVTPMYGGNVTLFRVYNPEEGEKPMDIRLRWTEFAAGVDIRDIVSTGAWHQIVLQEPHVRPLAEALEEAIVDALDASTA